MPELPEVETMARDLRPKLLGAQITDAWCDRLTTLRYPDLEAFRAGVTGSRILAVERRAKTVLMRLSSGDTIAFAPRMTGRFEITTATSPRHAHDRLGLSFADGRELRFRDQRTFGRVGLYPTDADDVVRDADGSPLFAAIGPEPLSPDFGPEEFIIRAAAKRYASRPLKEVLLDQGFLAGVGNIYADEVLWRSRLHPGARTGSMSGSEAVRLYTNIRLLLAEAIDARGSSVIDYMPPDGSPAMQEKLDVYGRAGLDCRRCGSILTKARYAGRGTVFCPLCQSAPELGNGS
jgi:formamidopyrimidine-DNA glycosylase